MDNLEQFLNEVNTRQLTDTNEKISLAIEIGLAVRSPEELQKKFPDITFDKIPYGNMNTYITQNNQGIPLHTQCSSCDVYLSKLLEDEEDHPTLQQKLQKLESQGRGTSWVIRKVIYSCPICKNYVGEIIINRPKDKS